VSYAPVAGTFKLYLQPDGSLQEEDSYERYVPVRDDAGSFAGIADVRTIASAAVRAAGDGSSDRAAQLLAMLEGVESVTAGVGNAVVAVLSGDESTANRSLEQLAERNDPTQVEMEVNATGYALMRMDRTEQALAVFELNTRVFPDAFNTWDSLGEALMNLGRNDAAISAYQRSLELNPENSNAEAMIERIRSGRP
jgi:tetratricopeptide (TPR) repeat protein